MFVTNAWEERSLAYNIIALFMFIPAISVVLVDRLITRRSIRNYGVSFPKFNLIAFSLALIYPWVLIILGAFISMGIGITVDFGMSSLIAKFKAVAEEYNVSLNVVVMSFVASSIIAPFINTIFAFGEELGWRGFLLDRLIEELGVVRAIILSGLIWGLWHYPIILLFGCKYTYETRFVGALIFLLFTVSVGIFLSWLKIRTGNVFYPSLAHGAINAYLGFGIYIVLTGRIVGYPAGIIPSCVGLVIGVIFMLDIVHWGIPHAKEKVH